ncbi:hypothetical protein OfM1_19660 [Lactovum odontotermitis]
MTETIKYTVRLSEPAKEDLKNIRDYILVNFYSRQSAEAKVDLILTALEILVLFPEASPTVESRGYGQVTDDGKVYRYLPIENYIAFFYIEDRAVYVARILSSRQDWAKLFMK